MKLRRVLPPPPERQAQLQQAQALERASLIALLPPLLLVLALTGDSRAMQAAWLGQLLALVPPLLFLSTQHFLFKPARERFPYGFAQAPAAALVPAASIQILVGLGLLWVHTWGLLDQDRPTIGSLFWGSLQIWSGWLMLAVLVLTLLPLGLLSRFKRRLARELNDKALYSDALTDSLARRVTLAAAAGLVGVALGWWWADPLAALLIGFAIAREGSQLLRRNICQLLDERPTDVDQRPLPEIRQLEKALKALPWVIDAAVRLREEGQGMVGEGFLVPEDPHAPDLLDRLEEARNLIQSTASWRVQELILTLVPTLYEGIPTGQLYEHRARALEAHRGRGIEPGKGSGPLWPEAQRRQPTLARDEEE